MAALKCRNSLQFSGFHLSASCWRRRCPTRSARRFSGSEQGSASSSLGAVCLTVYRVLRNNCQKRDQLPWGILQDWIRLRPARDRSTSAIFPFNYPTAPSARFWSPSGFYLHSAQGFFRPFPLLGWRGRGEAGAKGLLKKWFQVFCLQSAGGGEGWVVLLSACRGVATIFNSAVIWPYCL